MKKLLLLIVGLLAWSAAWADVDYSQLQNKVMLQLQSQHWTTTNTALVTVGVNASVTDHGIETIQASVMQKLRQLSDKGEWHVLSFDRQEDKSGLENVRISAQARLPQGELASLRNKAKTMSKPGEAYTIDSVQFTPSDDEIKQANVILRNDIYQQVKAEIDAVNKLYPDQHYYLHMIDFTNRIEPMRMEANGLAMARVGGASSPASLPVPVGGKIYLQANVEIASMPMLPSTQSGKI